MRLSRNPVHRVREYLLAHDLEALPDPELLSRFAATRDEGSFTALVRRHSPLVLGTARRVCPDADDADDVFQAAFLTLSRKAGSLRCDGTVAPWLHRVTFRLALRARKKARTATETAPPAIDTNDPLSQITGRELCSVIDEELSRLSARLQAPIVLCCLLGLTRDEAATKLGWSIATLKRRLGRAREVLEQRLRSRGVTLPAALAPAALGAMTAGDAIGEVGRKTVLTAVGQAEVPARVGLLCAGSGMAVKVWAVLATAASVVAVGLLFGLRSSPPGTDPKTPAKPPVPAEPATASVDILGDPLPDGAVARIGTSRFRHDEWLHLATWSPDGKYIASSAGRIAIIWDAQTGRELARHAFEDTEFPPRVPRKPSDWPSGVEALEWAPDGSALTTAFNGAVQVWSWNGETRRLTLQNKDVHGAGVTTGAVQFVDPLRLLTATGSRLTITDLPMKTDLGTLSLGDETFGRMEVSPDGSTAAVATGGDRGRLLLFDIRSPDRAPRELAGLASKMAFSRDGKVFAAVLPLDDKKSTILVWDATTWARCREIPYPDERPGEVRVLALSPDGKTVVAGGGDKILHWWDTTTGKEFRKIGPGRVYFNRASFRPDGKVLLTVSHENHVRLWDVESGKQLPVADGPAWTISAAAFTPDGKRALALSEQTLYCCDAATGRELWRQTGHTDTAVQLVITPDGKTAITSGNEGAIIFWNVADGRPLRKIENPRHSADIIALTPDGKTLAAIGGETPHDTVVRRWDVATGNPYKEVPLPPKAARYAAYSIRYAADGKAFAIASGTESQVLVFDPDAGMISQIFAKADGGINCAEYSADGRTIAAGTAGGSVYLWEVATGQQRLHLKDVGYTTFLSFSPDGRILAIANNGTHRLHTGDKVIEHTQDRTVVRLIDAYTGREFHRFPGHTGSVYRLTWSADGRRLMSGSFDSSCLIWDVSPAIRGKLPSAPESEEEVERLREDLGSPTAATAYASMAKLTGSPTTTVAELTKHLRPVAAADSERVDKLIRDLDSAEFAARGRATAELQRMGEAAEGALRTALTGKLSAEARDRAEKIVAEFKSTGARLWQGRAIEVLERSGDPAARRLLTEVAAGADGAWLTREAKASLGRMYPER
ncbi:MAG TPA: sigma-70 family RNA polymerase sigma factor [Gemmataceae bacterium]|nr:sigma-70 family RNA polymerase sigma factor [Gemmataceae bacterium]